MQLDIADISHIAQLARLSLTAEEKQQYAKELSAILTYIDMLNEVDTTGVEETTQVTGLVDVVREDEAKDTDEATTQRIIDQFPDNVGRLLKVQAVFDRT